MIALPQRLALVLALSAGAAAQAGDWAEWRGPERDGRSAEKGLPTSWSPAGQNLAWKAAFGGRSTPIVLGNRLYMQNAAGEGEKRQERVVCLNADTGKLLWEHRFNIYHSDVPPHRVGWASPAGDPATGDVYAFGVGGTLLGARSVGQGAVGAVAGRGLRPGHHARRPHGLAGDRRRPGDRQRHRRRLGRPGPGRPSVLRLRQEDGRDRLRELARRPAVRHDLLAAPHRHRQRRAPVDRRRRRRGDPRDQAGHRRAGLELRGEQARPQHRRAALTATSRSSATARRTSSRARWASWRASTRPPPAPSRRRTSSGRSPGSRAASRRRSWTAIGSTRSTTAPTCSPSTRPRASRPSSTTSAPSRRPLRCWRTASSTSGPRTASSSS